MSFEHSCFISYSRGQHELMRRFTTQFKNALASSLEPYLDCHIYIDTDGLQPGNFVDTTLSRAICKSAVMVVIHTPRYSNHPYCQRELMAMMALEQKRMAAVPGLDRTQGLIVPVLLRGQLMDLPDSIRSRQYLDFSRYSVADTNIVRNRQYVPRIEQLAEYISDICKRFEGSEFDFAEDCAAFELPLLDASTTPEPPRQPFPGRVGWTQP